MITAGCEKKKVKKMKRVREDGISNCSGHFWSHCHRFADEVVDWG
jgi:hypothetical protein